MSPKIDLLSYDTEQLNLIDKTCSQHGAGQGGPFENLIQKTLLLQMRRRNNKDIGTMTTEVEVDQTVYDTIINALNPK